MQVLIIIPIIIAKAARKGLYIVTKYNLYVLSSITYTRAPTQSLSLPKFLIRPSVFQTLVSYPITMRRVDSAFTVLDLFLSLCARRCLLIYLFAYEQSINFFFAIHLLLQI